jgi:hypothetical protein
MLIKLTRFNHPAPRRGLLENVAAAAFFMCALFSQTASGQIVTGSIVGTVVDPSGLAIPAAEVTLRSSEMGVERTMQTDARGAFVFSGLDAGTFVLTVKAEGFKTLERRGVQLQTGERLPVGALSLEVGGLTEVVTVEGAAVPVVQTVSAERAEVITSTQVDNLLIRGRNVKDLVGLLPGVVVASSAEDLSSASNFYVQGNRRTMNNISVDGVPATDMGNGFMMKVAVGQDAVSEVKILLSNYQAEYGRMSGSNIQIVTKSGTSDFHGLFSYYKRHEQFNANDFFDNRNGIAKPRYRYNTYTYNIGGPVYIPDKFNTDKDKLFFFWQQEFWPTKTGRTGRVNVPTLLERQGDFSQSIDLNGKLIAIKDPYNGGKPFPGNIIPRSRVDTNGQALLNVFAEPNFFDRGISKGQYNYVFTSNNEIPKHSSTLKLDYNANPNHRISGGFSDFREESTGEFGTTTNNSNWPQMRKTWWSHGKSLTGRYTAILSPTVINEFSFGWLSQPAENTVYGDQVLKNQRDAIGFNVGQFTPEANPMGLIPNATFGGIPSAANLRVEGRFPLFNRYNLFNWSDNLTLTTGGHTLKFGTYIERFYRHMKKSVNFVGNFTFNRDVNNPLDTNYAYANAMLGTFRTYTEVSGPGWMKVLTKGVEFFAQDNWKITPKLTLDYGLRMYVLSPIEERNNFIAGFVPAQFDPSQMVQLIQPGFNENGKRVGVHPVTGEYYAASQIGGIAPGTGDPFNGMVVPGAGVDYPRSLVDTRGIQWGPRFGFAYDVFGDGKTAIRGGLGMFYNRLFMGAFSNALVGQPPLLQNPLITYGELSNLLGSSGLDYPAAVFGADRQGKLPTVTNYSLTIQRDIGFSTVLDFGYVGSIGRHLLWRRNINPVPMGANFDPANADPTLKSKPLSAPFLRPMTGYNDIRMIEGASSSNYNSLQVSAKRRFTRGLQFGVSWTWSKAMDYNDGDSDTVSPLVPLRIWNYGLASFDRTHVLTVNYVWDVPNLPVANPFARQVFHGWRLSGISTFTSGAPLGIGLSTTKSVDFTGTASQGVRTVVVANPVLPKSDRTFERFFNTDAFQMPAIGTVGNAAKNVIRGPGINNWDVAIFKDFPIHERMGIQFRWEMYNAFNHTQFSSVDTGARFDPATGQQVNQRFGQFTGARTPRIMQFALRFHF